MKVLMFGWEFPPHISGGLGTACYGLTKGLSVIPEMDVLFVVPKAYGDEDQSNSKIIGANSITISNRVVNYKKFLKNIKFFEVESNLVPYTSPEEYESLVSRKKTKNKTLIQTNFSGKVDFSGKYGQNLFQEIANYAVVASVIAQDHSFDVIHAHDWLTYPAGIAAKKVSGKPLIVHVHATDFDRSGGSVNPGVYEIERAGMEEADAVITVSNFTRNIVIEKYGINPDKVTTVYNAVEPFEKKEFPNFRKGINDKVVTFLGRITLQKGPSYFIEAAYKVLRKMDNVTFVMAGSGDMYKKMVFHAASKKIMNKFHFTGFLAGDDVYKMFAISDVYVMPSVSEPFGISPLEAMQSNVPVIISKQSGVSEILNHAIKVDFWDVDAMADAIYGILNYSALGTMFGKYGKTEVDNLRWENAAKRVKEVYDKVMK